MKRFVNCIAHGSSEGTLIIGENGAGIFDCGMSFCREETIENVKAALEGRPLDYIFATHTHYDHIGALPFFRKEWPQVKLVTTDVGAVVLQKETPRRVIRELSDTAAKDYLDEYNDEHMQYHDDVFCADVIVKEGDIISLGELSVEVIETPGHTRDSLCYFVRELGLLVLCETLGVMLDDGNVYPEYLTSCKDSIAAIEKCRKLPYKYLSLPHKGVATAEQAAVFFDRAMETTIRCRDFIVGLKRDGLDEAAILDAYFKEFAADILLAIQPVDAFLANARATIACTVREME